MTRGARERRAQSNIVYSAYDRAEAPCDVRRFGELKPITHAHFDTVARRNWGFAKFQLKDSTGRLIKDSEVLRATYPWVDSEGDNIFFTSFNKRLIRDQRGTPVL